MSAAETGAEPGYRLGQVVEVRYPLDEGTHRDDWAWLRGEIDVVCPPTPTDPVSEWLVCVTDRRVAFEEDGELRYPQVYRSASEIRPRTRAMSGGW
jgi:hypothetical protein